jgi:O-antigen/teichoic acid export membrane protein
VKDERSRSVISRIRAKLFDGASAGVFRGMATLALGTGGAQLIGIAAIPILTRLYSPEDFGVLAVFTALVAILAPLVTLRYVLVLPLPRHDGVAMNLLVLSCVLMLTLSALIALALWGWGATLLALVSMEVLAPWWWLIALGVLGTAAYEMLTLWATRRRAYRIIAQTKLTQSAAGAAVKIGLGYVALQPLGLLIGQLVTQVGGVGWLLRGFGTEFRTNWHHLRLLRIRKVAWRHRGFPIWRAPSQFLMVFSVQAPILFMTGLFDAPTTGQFGLAVMTLAVPLNLVGQSASKALYGEASAAMKTEPERVVPMATDVQFKLFFMSLGPALLLFFFGEPLFVAAFGKEWGMAGTFASILSFALVFQFTSAPLVQLINLISSQSFFLAINSIRLIGLLSIFWCAAALSLDAKTTAMIYSAFTGLFYIGISFLILQKLKAFRCH